MSCRKTSKQKIFVFKENKSKLTLINKDLVSSTAIQVDGCEINDNSIRCDFMHIAKEIEFYIELKGQDLKHAQEQLIATIKRLSSNYRKQKKISYIICTRSPLSSTEIQNIKREFKKNYNSKIEIKSTPHIDSY
tara:strand:- start:56 stop:457 length:402 start_codon:yes stop_codon:yes gene_type:complete